MLFGKSNQFAMNIKNIDRKHDSASFRYCIANRWFGRPDPGATCISENVASMHRAVNGLIDGSLLLTDRRLDDDPALVLTEVYGVLYCDTQDEDPSFELRQRAANLMSPLMLAPDGSAAFDDLSLVVMYQVGVSVVIAGTYLDDSNHAGLNSREHVNTTDVAVYRSASVRDVVDVFEQCLDWVESLE